MNSTRELNFMTEQENEALLAFDVFMSYLDSIIAYIMTHQSSQVLRAPTLLREKMRHPGNSPLTLETFIAIINHCSFFYLPLQDIEENNSPPKIAYAKDDAIELVDGKEEYRLTLPDLLKFNNEWDKILLEKILLGMSIRYMMPKYERILSRIKSELNHFAKNEYVRKNFINFAETKAQLNNEKWSIAIRIKAFIQNLTGFNLNPYSQNDHDELYFQRQIFSAINEVDPAMIKTCACLELENYCLGRFKEAGRRNEEDKLENNFRHRLFSIGLGDNAAEKITIAKRFQQAIKNGDKQIVLTEKAFKALTRSHSYLGKVFNKYKHLHIYPNFLITTAENLKTRDFNNEISSHITEVMRFR